METQDTINAWGIATFGQHPALKIAMRMNLEVAELLDGLSNLHHAKQGSWEDRKKVAAASRAEVIDVWIMLCQVAHRLGVRMIVPKVNPIPPRLPKLGLLARGLRFQKSLNGFLYELHHGSRNIVRIGELEPDLFFLFDALNNLALDGNPSFQDELDRKVAILRQRTWAVTPTGKHQHVD